MKPTLKEQIHLRMLDLMHEAIKMGKAEDPQGWCKKIGLNYRNFSQKGEARQGYTDDQKLAAANLVGANMNWIFGLESNRLRKPCKDPIVQMKEALVSLEQERKVGKRK